MPAFTGVLQTGAATAANLGVLLRAAGYPSQGRPTMLLFDNPSTTIPIYLHFTNSNVAPASPTSGIPISAAAFPARRNLELIGSLPGGIGVDLNNIWIYAASDVPLTIAVAGN